MKIMRLFLPTAVLLIAVSSPLLFVPHTAANAALPTGRTPAIKDGDIYGFFIIKGTAPVGFRDIDHLNLGGSGEYGAGATPPYYGQIRLNTRAKTDFKLNKPGLNGKQFSFTTRAVRGVSYAFEGTLTRTDFDAPEQPASDEVVLRGKLKKMKAGKVIAQADVEFNWFLGD